MNGIKILSETPETVTVSRGDWTQLLSQLEDALDRAAVVERRRQEERKGMLAARRDYLTAGEARRLLDGDSLVRFGARSGALTEGACGSSTRGRRLPCRYRDAPQARQSDCRGEVAKALQVSIEDFSPAVSPT